MRLWLMTFVAGGLTCGSAAASSFVTIAAPKPGASPSIIHLEAIDARAAPDTVAPRPPVDFAVAPPAQEQAPDAPFHISASILSFGEPAVEDMRVSSIGDGKAASRPPLPPMVIRGGIAGDAFSGAVQAPSEPQASPEPAQAAADPAPERSPRPQPAVQATPQPAQDAGGGPASLGAPQ